jgi:hypothetical protein
MGQLERRPERLPWKIRGQLNDMRLNMVLDQAREHVKAEIIQTRLECAAVIMDDAKEKVALVHGAAKQRAAGDPELEMMLQLLVETYAVGCQMNILTGT